MKRGKDSEESPGENLERIKEEDLGRTQEQEQGGLRSRIWRELTTKEMSLAFKGTHFQRNLIQLLKAKKLRHSAHHPAEVKHRKVEFGALTFFE